MDAYGPIVIFIIAIIIITVCGYCCKRKREGTVYGYDTTANSNPAQPITGATPVVIPPYPVDPRHPTPHAGGPPAPGFATHPTPYPTGMPYPQPACPPGQGPTPYPPYPPTVGGMDPNAHPPPYDVAIATPPINPPPVREAYGKQAPYNPGYNN